MKHNHNSWYFAGLAAVFLAASQTHGQTVAWGTSVNRDPISFNSDGTLDQNSNLWTLGYFSGSFTPDATNFASWAANWNPVSSPTADGNGANDPHYIPRVVGPISLWSVSVNTLDVGAAAAGRQVYVFAYNDLGLIGTPDGEALLYRQDGLVFPATPNQITFDIADNPSDDGQPGNDDAFTVIWGAVDRRISAVGGVLTGGGIISDPQADSVTGGGFATFEAQFATWAPIPEPSVAVMAILGSLALFRRRR